MNGGVLDAAVSILGEGPWLEPSAAREFLQSLRPAPYRGGTPLGPDSLRYGRRPSTLVRLGLPASLTIAQDYAAATIPPLGHDQRSGPVGCAQVSGVSGMSPHAERD